MIRNTRNIMPLIAVAAAILIFNAPAQAAIVYVDAIDGSPGSLGNTYPTGAVDESAIGWTDNGDGDWRKRSTYGNGGVIYEGGYAGADDPELTTDVTGLAGGTYDVWVFFWDASGSNTWSIDAGLTSGSLSTYSFDGPGDTTSPVAASTLDFVANPMFTEGDRILYGVYLGQASVSAGTTLEVYVDNGPIDPDTRTWYDGVGYEANEIPEPASLAMGLLGMTLIAGRRRR